MNGCTSPHVHHASMHTNWYRSKINIVRIGIASMLGDSVRIRTIFYNVISTGCANSKYSNWDQWTTFAVHAWLSNVRNCKRSSAMTNNCVHQWFTLPQIIQNSKRRAFFVQTLNALGMGTAFLFQSMYLMPRGGIVSYILSALQRRWLNQSDAALRIITVGT